LERREATPETNLNRNTRVPLVSATPWGKGTGNPKMDSDGNILTKKSMSLDKKKVKKTVPCVNHYFYCFKLTQGDMFPVELTNIHVILIIY